MNNPVKEQIGCDVICRSHSARTERDLYRICPSKLSKRELEDLYFALLENNLELKKTVNVQQDKIKVLSTKVQRMAVLQKTATGKEKDCCASRAVVNEQKESISNLKKTNEHMSERIRLLNMRLCSAKQFLKRSPSQANNSKCTRCSFKNSSLSALNVKRTSKDVRTPAVSCQFLNKEDASARSTKTVETTTEQPEKQDPEKPCNENKCRTIMDELNEKILNLQEELSRAHEEYSQRISKLESRVSDLQVENLRVKSDHVASEHALQQRTKRAEELADKLRTSDATCNELKMELSIEKRRVQELETGLKLASMSDHVVQTIEQLTASNEEKQEPSGVCRNESVCSHCSQGTEKKLTPTKTLLAPSSKKDEVKFSKSDDSGYTELNKSCEADDSVMVKLNQDLLKKIAELQTQLDLLRISAAGESVTSKHDKKLKEFESYDVETKDVDETQLPDAQDATSIVAEPFVKKDNTPVQENFIENNTIQKDIDTMPVYDEAGCSKPLEAYLITGHNENLDVDRDDDNEQKSINSMTIKDSTRPNTKDTRDDHNRFQIPGPIPVNLPCSKDKRKAFKTPTNSKDLNGMSKKANSEEKTVKIFENSKDSYFYSDKFINNEPYAPELNNSSGSNIAASDKSLEHKDTGEKKDKNGSITDTGEKLTKNQLEREANLFDKTLVRDSIIVNRKKLASKSQDEIALAADKDSSTSVFLKCDNAVQVNTKLEGKQKATQIVDDLDKFDYCESRARICRCPKLTKRDLAMFRSCSGTLCFRTTTPAKLRRCGCQVQTDSCATQIDSPSPRACCDSATDGVPNTYTVQADKCERAASPDNTEHEISTMSDLPLEKYVKSPRQRGLSMMSPTLSPGEERATMTTTDTNTNTDTDYGSLSEGELPMAGKARRLSTGERHPETIHAPITATAQKMEATLQSIGEELARCRRLLLSQRPEVIIRPSVK